MTAVISLNPQYLAVSLCTWVFIVVTNVVVQPIAMMFLGGQDVLHFSWARDAF